MLDQLIGFRLILALVAIIDSLCVLTLSGLMSHPAAAGPRARARTRPWAPGAPLSLFRVQHEALRQIALAVLPSVPPMSQSYVMLKKKKQLVCIICLKKNNILNVFKASFCCFVYCWGEGGGD